MKQQDSKFIIVDAHAMAYRAYYALLNQNLRNSSGQPTGAVYGFFRMLFKLLNDYNPEYIAITWDPPNKTIRHQIFNEYKSHRKPMPDDLIFQIEKIKDILKKIGFPIIISQNYEADDIIGTLVKKFSEKFKIIIISGDKDCFQLLNSSTIMLRGKKGVTEFTEITPEFVKEELGVETTQIPDYLALTGDSSDYIPGAKGIGPKTASELIQKYTTIENLYQCIDEIKPSIKEKLLESKENVFLSKKLSTIFIDIPELQNSEISYFKLPHYLNYDVLTLFRKEGLQQIYKDLLKEIERKGNNNQNLDLFSNSGETKTKKELKSYSPEKSKYFLISCEEDLKKCIEEISQKSIITMDTETSSLDTLNTKLVGISLCNTPGKAYYISVGEDSLFTKKSIPLETVRKYLKKIINKNYKFIGQNIKFDYKVLKQHQIEIPQIHFDTMIASYLLNPGIRQHNLDDIAIEYLKYDTIKYSDIAGKGKSEKTFDKLDPEEVYIYACEDADITYQLYEILIKELEKKNLLVVNNKVEVPLIPVLAQMEDNGVKIDRDYFKKLSEEYNQTIQKLMKKIYSEAGVEFNINSTKELQMIIIEKMNLPSLKKTKTGFSTDQSVLESLRNAHPIIDFILEYRKLIKLKNTYIDVLPSLINNKTGRIHTNYSQTITSTGRLVSSNPNLQNIPVKEKEGRAIRRGFIAEKGYKIVSIDYSQIELRILAHYSNDKNLIEAFLKEKDIHKETAARLFKVSENEVTPEMRSKAKVLNFSVIYGVTPYGLSQNLGIETKEAKEYIDSFMNSFPGVQEYIQKIIQFAEKNGYVETLMGRRRYINDILSTNRKLKEAAQRIAINTPIQGTSADIIKMAMIKIDEEIQKRKMKSKMIIQVHDELVFETKEEELDELIQISKKNMENAIQLKVPLKVDIGIGNNWEETKN